MPTITTLIGDAAGPALLRFGYPRSIGMIVPDVTIEEAHVDTLQITDHPVEVGATISDHAFMMPPEVTMTVAFANSKAGDDMHARQMYNALLMLQQRREPFQVSTGKRIYQKMLVRTLMINTSLETESTLMVVATLRHVIITDTQGGMQGDQSSGGQANPASTAPVGDAGSIGTIPSNNVPSFPLGNDYSTSGIAGGAV